MAKRAVKDEFKSIGKESKDKVVTLIISAFGLVAALAWNSAIQAIFAAVFGKASTVDAMVGYAVAVTVIAVIVTIYLSRIVSK